MANVTTAVEAVAKPIGFDLGHSTDQAQADLLNGLAHGFAVAMPLQRDRDMQMAYLVAKLDQKALQFITQLAAAVQAEVDAH